MINRFRSKPVVIEAIQFDGLQESIWEILDWSKDIVQDGAEGDKLYISTLEGTMTAQVGDWIVKGLKGEFYPVKPDIMALKYEKE